MDELRGVMRELGISSYKTETYLSLIRIRQGTIQQLAKSSKVPSCKLYENLRWLHENGFITLISQKPLIYRANNPKQILKALIASRKTRLDKMSSMLESISFGLLPVEKDMVQITSTRDAFFSKMKEVVASTSSSIDYMAKHWRLDAELVDMLAKRAGEGVRIRALGPVNKNTAIKIKWLKSRVKIRIKDYDPGETHFSIYDRSIIVISLRKGERKTDYSAVWLKSETLAEILSAYFESIWKR